VPPGLSSEQTIADFALPHGTYSRPLYYHFVALGRLATFCCRLSRAAKPLLVNPMKHPIALLTGLFLLVGCSTFVRETPSSYMVFFQEHDTQLSAGARAVVDQAALDVRRTHTGEVMIAAGNATDDKLKLAEPRLLAVRQALIGDGVSDHIILRSAIAEASDSVGETGDQHVVITLITKTPS